MAAKERVEEKATWVMDRILTEQNQRLRAQSIKETRLSWIKLILYILYCNESAYILICNYMHVGGN